MFPFLKRRKPELPSPRDLPYVELRGGESSVLIIPALGGKIAELRLRGRQWLWHSPIIPFAPSADSGASFVETADSGGWDECFPTVGACRVPGWVRGAGGVELPEHGELWAQRPAVDIRTTRRGQEVKCQWQCVRLPLRLERVVRVDAGGDVYLQYTVHNDGPERLPVIWAAQPVLPLSEETELRLPEGARLRVYARHGIELGEERSEHQWPMVRSGGKALDFSRPFQVAKKYACKLFVDVPEGWVGIVEGGRELQLSWDAGAIPYAGLWINKRGWTPFRDQEPYLNLVVAPSISAPDTLSEALGDWKAGAWIDPGASREWGLRVRCVPAPEPVAATT